MRITLPSADRARPGAGKWACDTIRADGSQRSNRVTAADSRAEYERRLHRVLEAIDQRLDQPLDLASLAAVAHFSPYHFHRVFAAWMGETLGDYLRRRRVEQAASRLAAQPRLSVLQAALSVGFGSGEAFTRAFKARFGCSPTAWRAQRKNDQADSKVDQAWRRHSGQSEPLTTTHRGTAVNVQLIDRQPARVAYMRHIGPYGEPIGRFWQEVVAPWMVTDGLMGRARYGISHDDPSVTDPTQCRYDACVEVDDGYAPSGRALITTLPGGRYAVTHFEGTGADIFVAWRRLLGEWLPSSHLQLDLRPCFEHYPVGSNWDPETGVFDCEITIPVASL
jgi:AraC family transcriptional regulator